MINIRVHYILKLIVLVDRREVHDRSDTGLVMHWSLKVMHGSYVTYNPAWFLSLKIMLVCTKIF